MGWYSDRNPILEGSGDGMTKRWEQAVSARRIAGAKIFIKKNDPPRNLSDFTFQNRETARGPMNQ